MNTRLRKLKITFRNHATNISHSPIITVGTDDLEYTNDLQILGRRKTENAVYKALSSAEIKNSVEKEFQPFEFIKAEDLGFDTEFDKLLEVL